MPTPVYTNACHLWFHKDCFCLEFKIKLGEKEETVAVILMHPEKFGDMLQMMIEVMDLWKFEELDRTQFVAKWILIIVFMAISNMAVGLLFKLAKGDVLACAAVMALLTPPLIVIFILILKIVSLLFRPILRKFGSGDAYPFMPVVLAATIAVLGLGFYLAG